MKKADQNYVSAEIVEFQVANLKQITFEVTDACNLKCVYCGYGEFYEDFDQREDQRLSINKAIRLFDYLTDYWNSSKNMSSNRNVYVSFYGGEPLMNIDFIKTIIDYVSSLNCPTRTFTFSMTTNAILLNKYMDYLVDKKFNLLISLDGDAENTAYRVDHHNKPAFDRIIKNVDLLQEKHPEYFINHVNFNAVLHNKNSVEDIYYFFKSKYNKTPSIGELNNMGIKPEMQELFIKTYKNSQESLLQAENYTEIEKDMFMQVGSYRSLATFIHQYSGFVYYDYNDLLYAKEKVKKIPTGTCLPFSKKMYITVNGKILPCERIGHQYALGEITESGVELNYEKIAERYNQYYTNVDNQCKHCHNQKACIQCIFNLDDLENKPVCYGFMNDKDFEEYKKYQMQFLEENPEAYYEIMEKVIIQ